MRELFAYAASLVLHATALAAVYWLATEMPTAWLQRQGRARVDLVASIAAVTERTPTEAEVVLEREPPPPEKPLPDIEAEETALPRREQAPSPAPPNAPGELPEQIMAPRSDELPRRTVVQEDPLELRPPMPPAKRPPSKTKIEIAAVESAPSPESQSVEGTDVDELPRKMPSNPAPRYPAESMAARHVGVVLLSVVVRPDGTVDAVDVKTSSGYPLLDAAALQAVRAWRFEPGRKAGVAVTTRVNVPVRFGFAG